MTDYIYCYCSYNSTTNDNLYDFNNIFRNMLSISNNKLHVINSLIVLYAEKAETYYTLINLSNLDININNYTITNSINDAVGFPVVISIFRYNGKKNAVILVKKIYYDLLLSLNNRIIMCKIVETNNMLEYLYNEPIYIDVYMNNRTAMLNKLITSFIYNYVSHMITMH